MSRLALGMTKTGKISPLSNITGAELPSKAESFLRSFVLRHSYPAT
jgi:hypothetical protein